jgi:uncharacterized protein with GYD domain
LNTVIVKRHLIYLRGGGNELTSGNGVPYQVYWPVIDIFWRFFMSTYVILSNYTEQGIRNIKEAPQRLENMKNRVEKSGGKLIATYSLMGQYDRLVILELPNDEVAASISLGMGVLGNVRTTTMKAFTNEEFAKIIAKMP